MMGVIQFLFLALFQISMLYLWFTSFGTMSIKQTITRFESEFAPSGMRFEPHQQHWTGGAPSSTVVCHATVNERFVCDLPAPLGLRLVAKNAPDDEVSIECDGAARSACMLRVRVEDKWRWWATACLCMQVAACCGAFASGLIMGIAWLIGRLFGERPCLGCNKYMLSPPMPEPTNDTQGVPEQPSSNTMVQVRDGKTDETFETNLNNIFVVDLLQSSKVDDAYFQMYRSVSGEYCVFMVRKEFALQRNDPSIYSSDAIRSLLRKHKNYKPSDGRGLRR
jgi:hypothetical protein